MSKTVTFSNMECLLFRLGFRRIPADDSQLIYKEPASDALIVLPLYQADEVVRPHHWMSIRWTLDAWNIMDREAFDRWIETEAGFEASDCGSADRPIVETKEQIESDSEPARYMAVSGEKSRVREDRDG